MLIHARLRSWSASWPATLFGSSRSPPPSTWSTPPRSTWCGRSTTWRSSSSTRTSTRTTCCWFCRTCWCSRRSRRCCPQRPHWLCSIRWSSKVKQMQMQGCVWLQYKIKTHPKIQMNCFVQEENLCSSQEEQEAGLPCQVRIVSGDWPKQLSSPQYDFKRKRQGFLVRWKIFFPDLEIRMAWIIIIENWQWWPNQLSPPFHDMI